MQIVIDVDEETAELLDELGERWDLSRVEAAARLFRLASFSPDIRNAPAPPRAEPEEDDDDAEAIVAMERRTG